MTKPYPLDVTTLDEYLKKYGGLLGEQAQERLDPLHVPGRDPLPDFTMFKRKPFPAQQHVIAATVKAMRHQKSVGAIGECGTGKTIIGMCAVHLHAADRPYRAVVFAPGQLVNKWQRELEETIPHCRVTIIEHCSQLNRIRASRGRPGGAEWFVIARDRAKLGAKWSGQASERIGKHAMLPQRGGLRCPACGGRLEDKDGNSIGLETLNKKMLRCEAPHPTDPDSDRKCGEFLWSYIGKQQGGLDRFEPAKYIHKRMRGFFDYLIGDEIHEEKSASTAQANAVGSLMAAAKHVIVLTGTLIGGYAEHVRPLLFRMAPDSLVDEGLGWKDATAFNRRYGRIERTVITRSGGDCDDGPGNRQSRGSSGRKMIESVKPGIVPTLFGRHLLGNSLYLSLAEVSDKLPVLREIIVPVPMDAALSEEYHRVEDILVRVNKELCVMGNKALLGAMLQCLLCYPDLPYDWNTVGYWQWDNGEKSFVPVVTPKHMKERVWAKEKELIDTCLREKQQGRQCWVFVQYTDTRPVLDRIERLMREAGLRVGVLRASVPLAKREAWIAANCGGLDVVISHPKLVETGLDLFSKSGGHNFCTLMFYETGYNLFTLRQAARRSWRIGQRRECRVYYFYYEATAQAAAMALMGKKLSAAQALEGKFSADGLVAMGGDDLSVEMALAQSLDKQMPGDAMRAWDTIADTTSPVAELLPESEPIAEDDAAELLALLDDLDFSDEVEEDAEPGYGEDDLSDLLDGLDDLLLAV